MPRYRLSINGRDREVEVLAGTSLLEVLRDDLALTAAKYGCGEGKCGACVVMVDGEAAPSCQIAVDQVGTRAVVTAEGLDPHGAVARAFVEEGAMQCGYCTPALAVAATALLAHSPDPSEDEIRERLGHHLCRCGVYGRVVCAVRRAAKETR